jgi:response regulator RpfG family c-di-GMP phosphodiesterase
MEKQAAQLEEVQVEMEAQQAELLETENWFRSIIETAPERVRGGHGGQRATFMTEGKIRKRGASPRLTGFARTREVMAIQDVIILAMASLAETCDSDTGNHIRRTQIYVKALAEKLKTHPRFSAALNDNAIMMLFKSAPCTISARSVFPTVSC